MGIKTVIKGNFVDNIFTIMVMLWGIMLLSVMIFIPIAVIGFLIKCITLIFG